MSTPQATPGRCHKEYHKRPLPAPTSCEMWPLPRPCTHLHVSGSELRAVRPVVCRTVIFFCHGPHVAAIHVPVESSKGSAWAIEGPRTLCTGRVGVGGSWPCRAARCGQSLYLLRGGGGKFRASQADSKSAAPGCIVADKVGVEEFGRHTCWQQCCWQQPRARCRQLAAVAQTHNLLLMAPATA